MKIVADSHIPFLRGVLEPFAEVVYLPGRAITNAGLKDADALIVRTRTTCDAALLDGTKVRFIATATIGYDHVDTAYCAKRGIAWTNAEGCNSASVQQYIASALIHCSRSMDLPFTGKTIGIVGVGNVGSKVARLCSTLEMNILLNDPPRARNEGPAAFVPLETILAESDFISLHVPLNPDGPDKTLRLADAGFLSHLKQQQVLFNTCRGEVADGAALLDALRAKRVRAAVLDVWEHEPEIDLGLLEHIAIGTPHIAGYSADGKANGTAMSVQALSRFLGLPLNDWYPGTIPAPAQPHLEADCRGRSTADVLAELILATYDIASDDRRLRSSPGTFEQQRAEYPIRREFPAYHVRLLNADAKTQEAVAALGFRLDP
jgi:erythronate-4-phosphate dehydrogenase